VVNWLAEAPRLASTAAEELSLRSTAGCVDSAGTSRHGGSADTCGCSYSADTSSCVASEGGGSKGRSLSYPPFRPPCS